MLTLVDPAKWELATTNVKAGSALRPPKGDGWQLMTTHAVPVRWAEGHYNITTMHGAHVVCVWARPREQGAA